MSDSETFQGEFVAAEGDTMFFTQEEVAKALSLFVTEEEAVRIAAEMYATDPATSGIWFDENMYSALDRLSPELADRVMKLLNESPEQAADRRARFEAMLKTGKMDCC
jgi:hypothetical protein